MKCDICGSEHNVTMFMDGIAGITRRSEYAIRRAVESITDKKIYMPHLCNDCYQKYDFAGKIKAKRK